MSGRGGVKVEIKCSQIDLTKISLKNEDKIQTLSHRKKNKIITSRPACQERIKEVLQAEERKLNLRKQEEHQL